MKHKSFHRLLGGLVVGLLLIVVAALVSPAQAQAPAQKPNILFIMADDIGWMQVGIYHRGLALGETPNIDRIGQEGAVFTDYYAMQSCTSGRNAFFTGMYPLRTGMIPPQLPGSPSYLRPGTPAIAKFLLDLGYTTGQFGKNHLGDHTDALPTARLPRVLGLPLPPRRNAAGELSRYQQQPEHARGGAAVQEHAGSWSSRRPRCG
jgi:arylsulfatase A-like enzyme